MKPGSGYFNQPCRDGSGPVESSSPRIDQIIRSNRKTIALVVTREGKLLVRAPLRASRQLIESFVQQKAGWILEKQRLARQAMADFIPHRFAPGENFLYLGQAYPLLLVSQTVPALQLVRAGDLLSSNPAGKRRPAQNEFMPGSHPSIFSDQADSLVFVLSESALPGARSLFIDWYRDQARAVLQARINHYAALTGLTPAGLKITSATTRWGSCSAKGMLSFPWRLVMAPLAAIDYVVVHELVHLHEKNHARPFWKAVAAVLPEFGQQMTWLKMHGHLLRLD